MANRLIVDLHDFPTFRVVDGYGGLLGERTDPFVDYREFFDSLEDTILAFDCDEIESTWFDELVDLGTTYASANAHPTVREFLCLDAF